MLTDKQNPPYYEIDGNPKIWRGLITQSGTDIPTAVILLNQIGTDLIWTRNSAGNYSATAETGFPFVSNKTTVNLMARVGCISGGGRISTNVIQITSFLTTGAGSDDKFNQTGLEIIIYP